MNEKYNTESSRSRGSIICVLRKVLVTGLLVLLGQFEPRIWAEDRGKKEGSVDITVRHGLPSLIQLLARKEAAHIILVTNKETMCSIFMSNAYRNVDDFSIALSNAGVRFSMISPHILSDVNPSEIGLPLWDENRGDEIRLYSSSIVTNKVRFNLHNNSLSDLAASWTRISHGRADFGNVVYGETQVVISDAGSPVDAGDFDRLLLILNSLSKVKALGPTNQPSMRYWITVSPEEFHRSVISERHSTGRAQ